MTVFLLMLVLLCLIEAKVKGENEFFTDYADIDKANSIKGIFVVLVFFSHAKAYMNLKDANSLYYLGFQGYLAQMIVVPFLFFSGYGIMLSIKKKGTAYVNGIPKNRLLKVLIHFDIAVILFVLLNLIIDRKMTVKQILLSFTGWESIGNSNWYILAILLAYAATFISFFIAGKNNYIAAAITTMLLVGIIMFMKEYRPPYYYNTMLTYAFGMWYALFKDKLEKLFMRNDFCYVVSIGVSGMLYYLIHKNYTKTIWHYELWACLFMLILLLLTMKIGIDNGMLRFFGKHVFSIYILQRIPMNYINANYNVAKIPYVFLITSFIATIIIALIFDFVMEKLDGLLFNRTKKA